MTAYDIILKPVITERSMAGTADKKYTFYVATSANKIEVAKAVEEIFGVKVAKVNTVNSVSYTHLDPRVQGLISITRVDTTTDLRYCRVYVSALDQSDIKEVVKGLKSAAGYLRRELGHALTLRYTPELQFLADDSIERGVRMVTMIDHILEEDEGK